MSKTIKGNDGPVIGLGSSRDMYEKLKYESTRLQDGWHPYDTFNFLVTAWHLFEDWHKSDKTDDLSRTKRNRRKLPSEMNLILDVVRDLVNGSKHFQLTPKSANKCRIGKVHTGNEVGFYSYFFHEDLPGVTVEDYWYFSIRSLDNLVVNYFDWVFNETIPAKNFPSDLLEAILYCNIAERKSGPSPKVWLQGIESAYRRTTDK